MGSAMTTGRLTATGTALAARRIATTPTPPSSLGRSRSLTALTRTAMASRTRSSIRPAESAGLGGRELGVGLGGLAVQRAHDLADAGESGVDLDPGSHGRR